jgi:hypothetical protein
MSKRMTRIYNAVAAAGPDGVEIESLIEIMRDNKPKRKAHYGVLRVNIHEINRLLAKSDQRISASRRGAYRLMSY